MRWYLSVYILLYVYAYKIAFIQTKIMNVVE